MEKEERSEYISMYVTKSVKKEFEFAKENKTLQDQIIREFIKNEVDCIKTEMKELDEIDVIYRAKLISIRDKFSQAQDVHSDLISELYTKTEVKFKKIDEIINSYNKKEERLTKNLENISKNMAYISVERIERLMDAIDRFNKYSPEEKQLIELLINKS